MQQVIDRLLAVDGVPARDVLFVNLEDPVLLDFQRSDSFLDDLYQTYREMGRPGSRPHLFLDEIQNVSSWARWVRVAVERQKAHIYLSGSSSELLEPSLASVLTGRCHRVTLWPFSYSELTRARGLRLIPGTRSPADELQARHLLAEYLEFGGLPEVTFTRDETVKRSRLKELFRDVVHRDVVGRHQIRAVRALEEVAQYYLTNTAHLVTYNRLKNRYGLAINQLKRYTELLEECYLIGQTRRFDFKVVAQSKAPRKVFASDVGLRNAVSFRFSADLGWLAETMVYGELRRRFDDATLYYHADPHECDFVVWRGQRAEQLIQVCYEHGEIPARENASLLEAMGAFDLSEGLIVTDQYEGQETIEGKTIVCRPLWRWLLETPQPEPDIGVCRE